MHLTHSWPLRATSDVLLLCVFPQKFQHLASVCGLTVKQVTQWFANYRKRGEPKVATNASAALQSDIASSFASKLPEGEAKEFSKGVQRVQSQAPAPHTFGTISAPLPVPSSQIGSQYTTLNTVDTSARMDFGNGHQSYAVHRSSDPRLDPGHAGNGDSFGPTSIYHDYRRPSSRDTVSSAPYSRQTVHFSRTAQLESGDMAAWRRSHELGPQSSSSFGSAHCRARPYTHTQESRGIPGPSNFMVSPHHSFNAPPGKAAPAPHPMASLLPGHYAVPARGMPSLNARLDTPHLPGQLMPSSGPTPQGAIHRAEVAPQGVHSKLPGRAASEGASVGDGGFTVYGDGSTLSADTDCRESAPSARSTTSRSMGFGQASNGPRLSRGGGDSPSCSPPRYTGGSEQSIASRYEALAPPAAKRQHVPEPTMGSAPISARLLTMGQGAWRDQPPVVQRVYAEHDRYHAQSIMTQYGFDDVLRRPLTEHLRSGGNGPDPRYLSAPRPASGQQVQMQIQRPVGPYDVPGTSAPETTFAPSGTTASYSYSQLPDEIDQLRTRGLRRGVEEGFGGHEEDLMDDWGALGSEEDLQEMFDES